MPMQHMVILFSNNIHSNVLTIYRGWSISCSPFRHTLCPINNVLVVSFSCLRFHSRLGHVYSCRSFQISTAGWYVYRPIPTPKKNNLKNPTTVCLRRAGEILPDRNAIEENNDDKFAQLMRSKTVHLLALFVMVYIGVEVTIGGIIFVNYMIFNSLITVTINQDGL